jgi:hypothetical protein
MVPMATMLGRLILWLESVALDMFPIVSLY